MALKSHADTINMVISFVTYVGKNNETIFNYVQEDDNAEAIIHLQMIANGALDLVEERIEETRGSKSAPLDQFLGLLYNVDNFRVFGYVSNTKVKIIVVCPAQGDYAADSPRQPGNGQNIRELLLQLYSLYIRDIQNSLQPVNEVCCSSSFLAKVKQCVNSFQTTNSKKI